MNPYVVLSAEQTRNADQLTIDAGVASAQLMERAGEALTEYVIKTLTPSATVQAPNPENRAQAGANGAPANVAFAGSHPAQAVTAPGTAQATTPLGQPGPSRPQIVVLCGPGNNGGDGFVLARRLLAEGWPVRVALLGDTASLTGSAKLMAELYDGPVVPFAAAALDGANVIIDAIFGVGLSRPVDGQALAMVEQVNRNPAPVISVDIPTGINADTGAVMGNAVRASRTLTFVSRKPGHLLYPGRGYCGITEIAGIGISDTVLRKINPKTLVNDLAIWAPAWPRPHALMHKYDRGHVAVVSGDLYHAGAARLAAIGALRAGAGLVSLFSPSDAAFAHAAQVTSVMIREGDTASEISSHLSDSRFSAVVAGPGLGLDDAAREKVLACLSAKRAAVIDADGLSAFAEAPDALFTALDQRHIITPHTGEFARMFASIDLEKTDRLTAARAAADRAGCCVVLKGADTVIAHPDGRAAINVNAPPDLATAGSGDVLAGFIAALAGSKLPNGEPMPVFEAACGGVWLHGACGQLAGPGLIAEDLPHQIPTLLRRLSGQGT